MSPLYVSDNVVHFLFFFIGTAELLSAFAVGYVMVVFVLIGVSRPSNKGNDGEMMLFVFLC